MTSLKPEVIEDYFPPEVCPVCAYSLEGLPGEGICPECGNRYDSTELILYGWARGTHENAVNTRGKRLAMSLSPGFYFFYLLFQWHLRVISSRWVYAYIASWVSFGIWALMRRQRIEHPGGIQVRMNQRGVIQIDDVASLRAKPGKANAQRQQWRRLCAQELTVVENGRLRLKLVRKLAWFGLSDYPIDAELDIAGKKGLRVTALIREWLAADRKLAQEEKTIGTPGFEVKPHRENDR